LRGRQKEHLWLQKLVGERTFEAEASMGDGKPNEKTSGTERVRSLDGIWTVAEGQSEMMGAPATTIMTLGYDPAKKPGDDFEHSGRGRQVGAVRDHELPAHQVEPERRG
jgi:hypothetical protein